MLFGFIVFQWLGLKGNNYGFEIIGRESSDAVALNDLIYYITSIIHQWRVYHIVLQIDNKFYFSICRYC